MSRGGRAGMAGSGAPAQATVATATSVAILAEPAADEEPSSSSLLPLGGVLFPLLLGADLAVGEGVAVPESVPVTATAHTGSNSLRAWQFRSFRRLGRHRPMPFLLNLQHPSPGAPHCHDSLHRCFCSTQLTSAEVPPTAQDTQLLPAPTHCELLGLQHPVAQSCGSEHGLPFVVVPHCTEPAQSVQKSIKHPVLGPHPGILHLPLMQQPLSQSAATEQSSLKSALPQVDGDGDGDGDGGSPNCSS